MTPEQQAAFIISQSVCAMIEAMSMMTANHQREREGLVIAYNESHFKELADRYVIGSNAVVGFFHP